MSIVKLRFLKAVLFQILLLPDVYQKSIQHEMLDSQKKLISVWQL